ncbi:MAG TPA: NAD(P)-binding domain-containing protein, partial [Alphaproteobacteria bacterium]|nr:NAD(P)-binding domain-containing protein [Alphaproteobacteria bacterium]
MAGAAAGTGGTRLQGAGPLLLVGCGKMGGALLAGWLAEGVAPGDVVVVEPALDAGRASVPKGVTAVAEAAAVPGDFRPAVVVLAVKPQMMAEVVPAYARFTSPETVFMSIAAGTPVRFFAERLGENAAIVRVMPNTPAAVGRGMSVLYANPAVSPRQRALCS